MAPQKPTIFRVSRVPAMEGDELRSAASDRRDDGAGCCGSIGMKGPEQLQELTGQVHHLPCCIRHDGPCAVSDYFKPKKTGAVVDGLEVEEASFRGRRLRGTTLRIPDGYCGYILKKKGDSSEGNFIAWEASAKFENVTYWNHDNHPSLNDAFARSFHWFAVADALHKPVQTDAFATGHANGK